MSEIIEERLELGGLRLALATRSRRWWIAVTLALGAVSGPLIAATTPRDELTFALDNRLTLLFMTITLPFTGALLMDGVGRQWAAVRTALTLALGLAAFGTVVSAASVALVGTAASGGGWRHAAQAALGGVLVMTVCQLSGIGFASVIRRPVLACLATFLPLPVWGLLTVAGLAPLAPWLTPCANAEALLTGDEPIAWVRELVVVGVWGVGFWLTGAGRLTLGPSHDPAHP